MTCHSKTGCTAPLGPHPRNFHEAHKWDHRMGDDPLILQCQPELGNRPANKVAASSKQVDDERAAALQEASYEELGNRR